MASSPIFKIYSERQEYIASFKYPEDAALFIGTQPAGSTVRLGHSKKTTLWTEGSEDFLAMVSFDKAAMIIEERLDNLLNPRQQRV